MDDLIKELALDEAAKNIIGPDGQEMLAGNLTLGVEKVKRCGNKFYQLIWVNGSKAWSCHENPTEFTRKRDVVAAGEALVNQVKAKRFSEVTR
jgi:hypothetical protein